MRTFNMAASMNESTVASEYIPASRRFDSYQSGAARFVKEHPEYVEKDGNAGAASCRNKNMENEVVYISQNAPGIFTDKE